MSTIKQIAKKAGVSPTTVSNVLNGNTARVSAKTRDKVEIILREENYIPNMAAHILAHNNSRIVGVIMFMEPRRNETVLEDPFSSTILGAIEVELRHNGYFMMLHTTSDQDEVLRLVRAWKLAGLILLWVPSTIIPILKENILSPVIFIDSYVSDDIPSYLSVGLEDKQGGYEIVRYLLSMGHREMVFLANDSVFPGADYARFCGCREALEEEGLTLDEDRFIALSKDRKERFTLYRRLSTRPFPFTAIVFSADYYAAEAITFFQEVGVEIPRDLSVTGFDDNIYARLIRPRLTTVHQDVNRKGQAAVDLLMKSMHEEPLPIPHVRMPVRLKIRESVGRI